MSTTWRVSVEVPAAIVETFANGLDDLFLAITTSELEEDARWRIEGLTQGPPDQAGIAARLAILAAATGIDEPGALIEPVPDTDWLEHVYRGFPTLTIGRFFIHGSHHEERRKAGHVPLWIDAATAFGSGTHQSTEGCLRAIGDLARFCRPRRVLDMGCGSGILGIAAAKVWKRPVVAVDIDPEAARVTRFNAVRNGVRHWIRSAPSPGYRTRLVAAGRPYDLILSNILARPLARMAPDLARHLAPGGHAILAGLMTRQAAFVTTAHALAGLSLVRRYDLEGWTTLVLRR